MKRKPTVKRKPPAILPPKKNGRPLREFDKAMFEDLCSILCTISEIENILRCGHESLDKWCHRTYGEGFSETYKKLCDGGKSSLRRNQFHLSKTNASMCIWLGKQLLSQRDIPKEMEEFNGTLALLLEQLKSVKSMEEFKVNSGEKKDDDTAK